ncbi:acyl-CoA dehydrogenase [Sphingobium sp. SCG-1]|uniref:acyl-CoA dehydrogenase n=1 Tax=Sphingobium sp. SCG-1 TaxID=2072936 RepID=UPI000CD67770|nr:acyl-CoA dehydrogenase [Sphingobium sp. SCG-1]AUW58326.1 acyl-CoA dehydrogenase [Sphingobium sp. SCG-1]
MSYVAPTAEQKFLLKHIVGIDALAQNARYSGADADTVEAIVEGIGEFAASEYAPLAKIGDTVGARWNDGVVTLPQGFRDAYQAFVANGWGTIDGPTEFGGQGLPFALTTVVMEDLGSANLGFSLINMLTMGAVEALDHHGSPEQQAKWLPKIITGEWPGTMNLTEPQAGSDVGALRTTATPVGDGTFKIKGQKIYITFGEHDLADNIVHLVLARTPGAAPGTKGISLFVVPKLRLDEQGNPSAFNDVRCVSIEHKLGIHASPTCVLSFGDNDDCIGELVGAEGAGMRAMFTMMNNARLNVGSQGVQASEAATQMALAYARERVQTPRADGSSGTSPVPIIEHPDVRRMLLRMIAQTQAARALIYYAAGQVDRARTGDAAAKARLDLVTPLAKAHGTDVGCEVASLGVQVHGGMGFIEETGAARHYRDVRITPIYEGTNGIQAADLVGRKLGGDSGAALRALIADIRGEARDAELLKLADEVEQIAEWMLTEASVNDRLAGSYPFLTMLSTLTCGWLMERQQRIAGEMLTNGEGDPDFLKGKQGASDFYFKCIVPEARGLYSAAKAGSALLYETAL